MRLRSLGPWLLAATPALVATAVAAATRAAGMTDNRIAVSLSALASDWLIAFGVATSVLVGIVTVVWRWRDRRAARAAVRQRRQAAADRRRLLQRLDHELKNPLTAMHAAVANLAATGIRGEGAGAVRSIREQVVRLSRLTSDLRKVADLEHQAIDRTRVDINDLLDEAMEVAREQPLAAHRRLTLHVPAAPGPLPPVVGDRDLLGLAVFNLIDNAIKFTGPGDTIDLRGREDDGWVVVEVADTGPGIAEDDLPLVWDDLYRAQRSRAVPGSGLGLSLVTAIVERHGGTVAIDSRLDQGTAISMRLPVARVTDR